MFWLALACAQNRVGVEHAGQFEMQTAGLAFVEHRREVTIAVGNAAGGETSERDLGGGETRWLDAMPAEIDVVVAGGDDQFAVSCAGCEQVVVVASGSDAPAWTSEGDVGPGAVFLADGALVGPASTCGVSWLQDGRDPRQVDVPDCITGAFAVDAESGRAFLGTSDGIVVVDADGAIRPFSDVPNDRLAWSDGLVYAATVQGRAVTALDADTAAVRWTAPVDGAMTAIAPYDTGVAWAGSDETGLGRLVYVDSATGAIRQDIAMPSAPEGLQVSATGEALALLLPNEVHFFLVGLGR